MDTLSHSLWGYGLFGYRGYPCLAILFGTMPHLLSFGIIIIRNIITGSFTLGRPALDTIPAWTVSVYDFTHSLVVAGVVIAVVHIRRKDISFAMFAWPFHVLLDIPFHTADYFPTKMFWPLTSYFIDGIAWSTPWVWLSNLMGLLVIFSYRWYSRKKKNKYCSSQIVSVAAVNRGAEIDERRFDSG